MPKKAQGKPRIPPAARERPVVQHKVVELSLVDEGTLERTLNQWVGEGWTFESLHFAMRESSKRPAMAFVLFTREGLPAPVDEHSIRQRLRALSEGRERHAPQTSAPPVSAHEPERPRTGPRR